MEIIKKTKSICPVCFKVIDATIFVENSKVFMKKSCDNHGEFRALLERDAEIYKQLMNSQPKERNEYIHLSIPFSYSCNLNCNYCWLPKRKKSDMSLEKIKKCIEEIETDRIVFSGGEPTVRKDLFEMIKFVKKNGKSTALLTNGIKLADPEYVKKLVEAGLDSVTFSMNGMTDGTFELLSNRKLLKLKLKALENLKSTSIYTILSMSILRGVNEHEINNVVDYIAKNRNIKQLRIRSTVHIGRYVETKRLFLSDLLEMVSKVMKLDKEKIVEKYLTEGYLKSPCRITFDVSIKGSGFVLANKHQGDFCVELRSWPDKYGIDLEENGYCQGAMMSKKGEAIPFCHAIIMNENEKWI
jgi:hypothetical protein